MTNADKRQIEFLKVAIPKALNLAKSCRVRNPECALKAMKLYRRQLADLNRLTKND